MRTQKQINAEIKKLELYKARVRQGMFSDNVACIEAQIEVLSEMLTEECIYERWPSDEDGTMSSAIEAYEWKMGRGRGKTAPSLEWKPLLVAK